MSRKPSSVPGARPHAKITGERAIHFLLTDAYFVVANHGRPLTRLGLDSLCLITKSPKAAMKHSRVRPGDAPASADQLEEIRDKWLFAMKENPDRVASNATREAELAASLADKLIAELMQNANDASAAALPNSRAMLLGKAGKGFRATLNLTDGPRIYSGGVSIAFDPARAHKALKKLLGRETPSEMPILRLPFPTDGKKEPTAIRNLIEQYDTVIVMPFRGLKACERCRTAWDEMVDDVTLLQGLPALNVMIWERDDATAHYTRTVRRDADNRVSSSDEGRKPGPVELVVRYTKPEARPAAERTPVAAPTRRVPRVTVSAEVVSHVSEKDIATKNSRKKPNGTSSSSTKRKTARSAKPTTPVKAAKTANGKSASKSTPTIKKTAAKAKVSVSEKGTKTAARKPAAKSNGKNKKTMSATAATKSTRTAPKAKTAKSAKARKPAASKPTTAKPAAKKATAAKTTKAAGAKAKAKPHSSSRAAASKKPQKSKSSGKTA